MESALTLGSSPFHLMPTSSLTPPTTKPSTFPHPQPPSLSSNLPFPISKPFNHSQCRPHIRVIRASSNPTHDLSSHNSIIHSLKATAGTIVFAATAFSIVGKFHQLPARAESPPTLTEELDTQQEQQPESSPLTQFLESNYEAIEALKTLLQQKLEAGEDEESYEVLKKLVSAQPENTELKFLMARLLNEMGETQQARNVFEEVLARNPLSFEALFENALLMDRCGEGEAVIKRLEEALKIAEDEKKVKEARDVRLIMAQIQFLQKNVEEALRSYEELEKEDPNDFRPHFCKGMIYSLLDKNKEAREQFAKYRELSPKKFEVEGYLRTPLSRMKLFGSDEEN
ncbi:unnamed protein product [Ilex paraguariensis]|uniref:Protein SLOW GREEN 1, chloroplastic n=1 Tax=Ilex paraguariensis TaxID=185542 RepID=A0ABC8R9U4_9AQUA